MNELASKLALGPVLLAQGMYVRRKTVRLPEPVGERSGVAGAGPRLRVLIAGDSSAAGVGVGEQRHALAGQLSLRLAVHYRVEWSLQAQSGLDSAGILDLLRQAPEGQHDIAVLCCGVNDVTGSIPPAQSIANVRKLRELLTGRFGVRHLVLSPLPPMHLFPALPQPLRWFLGERAHRVNQMLRAQVPAWPDCTLIDYAAPVSPDAIAADGFHPGAGTYGLWAGAIAQAVAAANPVGHTV